MLRFCEGVGVALKRFDFHSAATWVNPEAPAAFAAGWASIGEAIGSEHLGGNLLSLAPGITSAPYHWEAGQEEWLLVLQGTPTVRTPEGEQELRAGDVVCFPVGPVGAHQIINRSDEEVRIILFSDIRRPEVIVYPDSNKVMITDPGLDTLLSLDAKAGYWDGEA